MTPRPKTKTAIRTMILAGDERADGDHFTMESANTVDAQIWWAVGGDQVEVRGFATETERGITTVDELVDYAWIERKRIVLVKGSA